MKNCSRGNLYLPLCSSLTHLCYFTELCLLRPLVSVCATSLLNKSLIDQLPKSRAIFPLHNCSLKLLQKSQPEFPANSMCQCICAVVSSRNLVETQKTFIQQRGDREGVDAKVRFLQLLLSLQSFITQKVVHPMQSIGKFSSM
jgi:hypothetical protein